MVSANICNPTRTASPGGAAIITTRQGFRLGSSTGGVLTRRGADIILIDDPLTPEEALSEAQRRACKERYHHALYSRRIHNPFATIAAITALVRARRVIDHRRLIWPEYRDRSRRVR